MQRRHPQKKPAKLPTLWLMTDERMGERLWTALERLPRGSGVVFRHYGLASDTRRLLFRRVAKMARKRNLVLVRAGRERLGRHEDGVHNCPRSLHAKLRTASAHSRREAMAAVRRGADAVFVSPVFATRSHPGARALGRARFGLLIRTVDAPVIALGGMNRRRARTLPGIHGWAGIDALS